MDLLLWRHGEAEAGPVDMDRRLTHRGQRQAQTVGKWILAHRPRHMKVLVSPSRRTQQTALALGMPFDTLPELGPQGSVADLLAVTGWPGGHDGESGPAGSIVVVGHQPTLGRLASLLLAGHEADWTVKKGALWWFSNRVRLGETQTILRAMLTADLAD